MVRLPEDFRNRMKNMLGEEEYEQFLSSYDRPREYGLRVNRLKCGTEEFAGLVPWKLDPIPWVENGYFYPADLRPAQHPFYTAGLFYLQEPSAMTPASRLEICEGDRVLDLCAAPGGKATELAAKLGGSGLLVANDISNARAKALLHNLELFGAANIFVTNETPERLSKAFPEYFTKILVDAPCSGEGMFRKDEAVIGTWSLERTEWFAAQQREITGRACEMLAPGGWMLYSTCTFAPCEDEGTVSWILEHYPDMELMEMESCEGFSQGVPEWGNQDPTLKRCIRIWPHRMNGEGHFLALFHKKTDPSVSEAEAGVQDRSEENRSRKEERRRVKSGKVSDERYSDGRKKRKKKGADASVSSEAALNREQQKILDEFMKEVSLLGGDDIVPELRGEKVFLVPKLPDTVRGLHFLRCGLYAGDLKKNRFEPSTPLAHGMKRHGFPGELCLLPEDERVDRFLKGETLILDQEACGVSAGWILVTVSGYPIGWGKLVNGILKNHYPVSWRKS